MTPIKACVLAAGKGTRLNSEQEKLPKVMRPVLGRPMLSYVLESLDFIAPEDITIVVGFMAGNVQAAFGPRYRYALQEPQLGTGHAVDCARAAFEHFQGPVLVCYGDMPLVRRETYEDLLKTHLEQKNQCTLLAGFSSQELGFGRVLTGPDGSFERVVEYRDCTPEQRKIQALNAGIYFFDAQLLAAALPRLQNQNAAGEYYLTDVPALLKQEGYRVGVCRSQVDGEILGVNTLEQLNTVEENLRARGRDAE